MTKDNLCVWWLNQDTAEYVYEYIEIFPKYIQSELESLYGRAGRGRIWTPNWLSDIAGNSMNLTGKEDLYKATSDCAGLVFHDKDLPLITSQYGLITDFKLNLISNNPYQSYLNSEWGSGLK